MKEQLLERLKLMDETIQNKGQQLQQANADLNLLNGQRLELVHIINLCDKEQESKEPLHDLNEDKQSLDKCSGE